jgi:hypothetical protein
MPSSVINSDDGVISGTSGIKTTGGDDGVLVFQSKGTETARINTDKQIVAAAGTASLPVITTTGDLNTGIFFPAADTIAFAEGGAEAMRINSSGNLLVGTTNSSDSAGAGFKVRPSTTGTAVTVTQDVSGGFSTYHVYNVNATNNGYRFYVNVDGGIANFSGNNVNLSDERTKKNIEVAGSYLDKICAIPVKLFNYKDEAEEEQRTLGVIAQDVEAVAPEFVNNDGWVGTAPEDDVPLKTIYTTDMMFGLMKAIQEQQAIITALTARVEALEGAQA